MAERLRTLVGYVLVAALAAYVVSGRMPGCNGLAVREGEPAPAFLVRDHAGREWSPAAFEGRPYALVFFATWCHACRDELPMLARTSRDRPDLGLLVVSDEAPATVADYLARARLVLPAAGDGERAFRAYGVRALPSAVLVDASGAVVYSGEGPSAVVHVVRRLVADGT